MLYRSAAVSPHPGPLPVPGARGFNFGRVISLDATPPEGARRFLSALPAAAASLDGDKPRSWVTLTRTGTFSDPRYGEFEISRPMLLAMVENFNKGVYGQQIFIDVDHKPSNGAAGTVVELALEGGKLRALVEWTPYGVDAIKNRNYIYLSVEYVENWRDNEKQAQHGPVLLGAALTIRPCIKHLDPVQLSMPDGVPPTLISEDLQSKLLTELSMNKVAMLAALVASLKSFSLAEAVVKTLSDACEKALGPVTDEVAGKALVAAFEASGKQLAEQIGDKVIKLDINLPELKTGMTADDVRKVLAEEDTKRIDAAKKLAETTAGKVKLLTETIAEAKGIPAEMQKELAEGVKDLVGSLSDDQVKQLAATLIAQGNSRVAATKLAGLGYEVRGTTHITVDSSNEVAEMQEHVDKRLFERMPNHKRYQLSGGEQVASNKTLVEDALKLYDQQNGRKLHEEYQRSKKLAAGDSVVSDVSIPAIFERTVIREALYQLVSLGLMDVGTDQFSAVLQLPYSYRDTTAAGVANLRKYEGQSILRAAVKQAMEDARPIPQKIAFEVSDELRYLTSNGQINFDIVAENARNAARIVGEDIEALSFNELLNAADQFSVTTRTAEAVATANGTNTIFKTDFFPVVRPKKVYDLQGNQVGSTLYPITVSTNAVNRAEYDFTNTQSAGLYWWMDYNLGEIHFVTELGAPSAPTNTHAVVATYTSTNNVYAWDSDLGSLTVEKKYNEFLYRFGLRKTAVEDRAYMPNVATMSGVLRSQIEQAEQFAANFTRPGTDLQANGNLGRIKDVPAFRSYAPGLAAGDQRVVLFERGTTRFRMLKPWTLGQLENQKDSNGRFTGKKEAYGDQFIVIQTPQQLRGAFTSMVVYSATARADRAS